MVKITQIDGDELRIEVKVKITGSLLKSEQVILDPTFRTLSLRIGIYQNISVTKQLDPSTVIRTKKLSHFSKDFEVGG